MSLFAIMICEMCSYLLSLIYNFCLTIPKWDWSMVFYFSSVPFRFGDRYPYVLALDAIYKLTCPHIYLQPTLPALHSRPICPAVFSKTSPCRPFFLQVCDKHFKLSKSKTECLTFSSYLFLWSLLILEMVASSFSLFKPLTLRLSLAHSPHIHTYPRAPPASPPARTPTAHPWTTAPLFPHLPPLSLGLIFHFSLCFPSDHCQHSSRGQFCCCSCITPHFRFNCWVVSHGMCTLFAVACKTSSGLVSCQLAGVFLHKSSYPATVTWAFCCGSNVPYMPSSSAWKTLSSANSSALSLTPLRHLLKSHFLSEAFLAQHFPCPSSPSILCFIFLRGFYPSEPYYG